jgi:hypothetical protein
MIATCYALRSRLGTEECKEDIHCLWEDCNQVSGTCRSLKGEICDESSGCIQDQSVYECGIRNEEQVCCTCNLVQSGTCCNVDYCGGPC